MAEKKKKKANSLEKDYLKKTDSVQSILLYFTLQELNKRQKKNLKSNLASYLSKTHMLTQRSTQTRFFFSLCLSYTTFLNVFWSWWKELFSSHWELRLCIFYPFFSYGVMTPFHTCRDHSWKKCLWWRHLSFLLSLSLSFNLVTFIIVQMCCPQIKQTNHVLPIQIAIVSHSDKHEL